MRAVLAAAFPAAAAAVVVAAVVVPSSGADSAGAPRQVDVTRTSYACPAGAPVTIGAGQVRPGERRDVLVQPGSKDGGDLAGGATEWDTAGFEAAGAVISQTGRRSGAVGFFAGRAPRAGGGGLVVGRCTGVVDDGWYVGAGGSDDHASTLILSNLGDTQAVADVRLWGTDGPIDALDASGITLDPFEVRRIPVADLAEGDALLGLQVQSVRGAISAVVNDGSRATFSGTEAIEPSPPARDQLIGGIAGPADGKTLILLNPGRATARVDVEVLSADGTFAGRGLQDLKIEPGTVREVDVPTAVGAGRQAFHLTSDRPVAATVRMSPDDADYALAEPTAPLDGEAVVPIDLGPDVGVPKLVLTAPGRTASVEVEAYDDQMSSLGSTTVGIEGGTTAHVDAVAKNVADDAAYVVVRARGDVVGAATYVDGDRVSSLALVAAPRTVEAPTVTRAD